MFGILILVAVYILIIFELVHRAIAALIGSFWALAFLSVAETRPSFDDVTILSIFLNSGIIVI